MMEFDSISSKREKSWLVVSIVILTAMVVGGAALFWTSLSDVRTGGSDSPWEESFGSLIARDFSLQVLYYPPSLKMQQKVPSRLSLEDLQGKFVLINFWASWCVTCRDEAPLLEAIWKRFHHRDLVVVGAILHDDPVVAAEYAHQSGKTYVIAYDDSAQMSIDYGVTGVPETLFLDPSSHVYTKVVGALEQEPTQKILTALFKKTRAL